MARPISLPQLLAAALLAAAPAPLLAVPVAVDAQSEAIILKPLSLLKIEDMDFGVLFPSTAAETAILDPVTGTDRQRRADRRAATDQCGGVHGRRNAPRAGHPPDSEEPITLTRVGGSETMTVSNFTLDGPQTRHINPNEAFSFKVGGQLNVGAGQVNGTYVGTFEVTAQYQ